MSKIEASSLSRVLAASAVGSALEWYDFFVYGTAAALIFNDLFFPKLSPLAGTLASVATFGFGFIARPFGGLFFGNMGDRVGRQPVLVATLLIVGIGTALIGVLPTYATIGIWAPIILVVLRLLQGFASGAEYGGAVLLAVEYSPPGRRGLFGSLPTLGVIIGSLSATGVFAAVSSIWKDELLEWAWRIPFLLSLVLVGFGIFIRLRVRETPVFREVIQKRGARRFPVIDAIRSNPRNFFVVVFASVGQSGLNYSLLVFGLTFMTAQLNLVRSSALSVLVVTSLIQLVCVISAAVLSDRVGRRPVYLTAALVTAALMIPFFAMLLTRRLELIYLAYAVVGGAGYGAMFGAQAAFFAELFGPGVRYSGFAFAREIGLAIGGGTAPVVSIALAAMMGGQPWAVACFIIALLLVTSLAVYLAPETYRNDIRDELPDDAMAFRLKQQDSASVN